MEIQFYYFIAGEVEAQREEGLSQGLTGVFKAGNSGLPKVRFHVVYLH